MLVNSTLILTAGELSEYINIFYLSFINKDKIKTIISRHCVLVNGTLVLVKSDKVA